MTKQHGDGTYNGQAHFAGAVDATCEFCQHGYDFKAAVPKWHQPRKMRCKITRKAKGQKFAVAFPQEARACKYYEADLDRASRSSNWR